MKIIVTLFWSLAIGQVVGYIMLQLAGVKSFPEPWVIGVSLIFGLFVLLINAIAIPKKGNE